MITYCTYLDHIERGGFRPDLIVSNWNSCDRRVIYCPASEVKTLEGIDVEVIEIGSQINVPSDIPKAFNTMVDVCEGDWIVQIFGDIYLTAEGDKFIFSQIQSGESSIGSIPAMGISLYSQMYMHPNQIVISKRGHTIRRDEYGDGEVMEQPIMPWTADCSLALDIGYLGTPQYFAKMHNNLHIWPDLYKSAWIKAYISGQLELAVRMAYDSIRKWRGNMPLIPWAKNDAVLDMLNLQSDYEFCQKILEEYI